MANRYWVGGTNANWATTNWSLTDGGTGGQATPTSADDVFFTASSPAVTVTIAATANCRSISFSGWTGTLAGTSALNVFGNWYDGISSASFTHSGTITFSATTTGWTIFTTGGLQNNNVTFNGAGGAWTLTSPFGNQTTNNRTLTLTAGTFITGGYNCYFGIFSASGTTTRTLDVSSGGIFYIAGTNTTVINFATTTNLTVTGVASYGLLPISDYTAGTTRTVNLGTLYTEANAPNLTVYSANDNISITGEVLDLTFTGYYSPSNIVNAALTIFGNVYGGYINPGGNGSFTFATGANAWTFSGTGGPYVIAPPDDSGGGSTINIPMTINGVGGTWGLYVSWGDSTNTRALTLTAGTLYLYRYAYFGSFSSSGSTARAIIADNSVFGGSIPPLYLLATNTTIWNTATTTNFSSTDISVYDSGAATTGTRTVTTGLLSEAVAPSFYLSGTDTLTFTATAVVKTLDLSGFGNSGFGGTITHTTWTIYGGFSAPSIGWTGGASVMTFAATSGNWPIYNAYSTATDQPIIFNGAGGTWYFSGGSYLYTTSTVTLTAGTINFGDGLGSDGAISCDSFLSSNTNTRALNFGSLGSIQPTGTNKTIWDVATATNLTVTASTYVGGLNVAQFVPGFTRTISHGSTAGGSESNAVNCLVNDSSADTITFTSGSHIKSLYFAYYEGTATIPVFIYSGLTLYPTMTVTSSATALTFAGTSAMTIDTSGVTIDQPVTISGVGGTLTLSSAVTVGTTRTVTLSNGTLALNSLTLTAGILTISGSPTLAFGTGQIYLTSGPSTIFTQSTTATITGTPIINLTSSSSTGTRLLSITSVTEANSISYNVTAGTDIIQHTNIAGIKNLDFTGFSGSFANNSRSIFGNLTISRGMTLTAGTLITVFGATSGTKTITSNAKTFDFPVTFDGVGGTWQLQDTLTVGSTRTVTLTNGALNLNNLNLACGIFSSNNSNTRTLAFGTGQVYLTGNAATVLAMGTLTGYTYTGSNTFNATYNGGTGTRVISAGGSGGSEANAPNVNVTAGTDAVSLATGANYDNLNFTGYSGTLGNFAFTVFGNLTISSGMSIASGSGTTTFGGSTGPYTIISAGKTFDFPITFNGTGTWKLMDALAVGTATARTVTLTLGNLNLNNNTLTIYGGLSSTNTNTRSINFGTAGIYLTAPGAVGGVTIWTTQVATGLTIYGTNPTVYATGSSAVGAGRGITASVTGPAQTNVFNLYVATSSGRLEMGGGNSTFNDVDLTNYSGYLSNAGNTGTSGFNLYGSLALGSGMTDAGSTTVMQFLATTPGKTITTNGFAPDRPITFNGVGGTWTLLDALAIGSTRTATLTAGTVNLNNNSLTCGFFNASGTTARTLAFGSTGQMYVTGNSSGVFNTDNGNNMTVTGTAVVNATYSGATGTRTIDISNIFTVTEDNTISVNITAGTDSVALYGQGFKNVNWTGFGGTMTTTGLRYIYGNWTFSTGMTVTSGSGLYRFFSSGTQLITSNGKSFGGIVYFGNTATGGGRFILQDAFSTVSNVQHDCGTIDLNNNTLTAVTMSSNNSNVRSLAFGSGQIYLTGTNATIWSSNTGTNLTITGTPVINATGAGTAGQTRTFNNGAAGGGSEANSLILNITDGADSLNIGNPFYSRGYNFTGFSGTLGTTTANYFVFGNVVFSPTMSLLAGNGWTIFPANGTANITSNGITIDSNINCGAVSPATPGSIVRFADALTMGSTRTLAVNGGTVILPAGATSTVGAFSTSGTAMKYLKSTVAGTRATLSQASGTVTATYLAIQDSAATGGATWTATSSTNVNSGDNTGWNFGTGTQTYRLTNTGTLQTNKVEMFEVNQTAFSMAKDTLYAVEFDEVTATSPAMSLTNTGTLRVATEFDEVNTAT